MKNIKFTCLIAYSDSKDFSILDYNQALQEAAAVLGKYGLTACTIRPITGLYRGGLEQGLSLELITALENPHEDFEAVKSAFVAAGLELKELWAQEALLYAEDSMNCLLL